MLVNRDPETTDRVDTAWLQTKLDEGREMEEFEVETTWVSRQSFRSRPSLGTVFFCAHQQSLPRWGERTNVAAIRL